MIDSDDITRLARAMCTVRGLDPDAVLTRKKEPEQWVEGIPAKNDVSFQRETRVRWELYQNAARDHLLMQAAMKLIEE